jgi:iron complex transport system permease protein
MRRSLYAGLALALAGLLLLSVAFGEVALTTAQYARALTDPESPEAEVLWAVRAPRGVCAALVGACLGLSGALMQGLLRNPLADPGVLGVSALAALGSVVAIVLGLAAIPGAVELAALGGAAVAASLLVAAAARLREPEALILFGVAVSAFAGALLSLVFNLSPAPLATSELLAWSLGSVENRSWTDASWTAALLLAAAVASLKVKRGLRILTLGEDTAATLGESLPRLKAWAVAAAALATGAAVAVAGAVGFVGLIAPHLVRAAVREDPSRLLGPSALTGAALLVAADLVARVIPTEVELKLGVVTALVGAPLFALVAWRAARSWRG